MWMYLTMLMSVSNILSNAHEKGTEGHRKIGGGGCDGRTIELWFWCRNNAVAAEELWRW